MIPGLRQRRDLAVDERPDALGARSGFEPLGAAVDHVVQHRDLLLEQLLDGLVGEVVQLQAGVRDGMHGLLGPAEQAGSLETGGAHSLDGAIRELAGLGLQVIGKLFDFVHHVRNLDKLVRCSIAAMHNIDQPVLESSR
jgi:hypothetical protein